MHDNFSGRARRGGGAVGAGEDFWQTHAPRKFHAICYVLCASSADGGECYAWESQNDRLQFIQFILLSQTFVSAHCVCVCVCARVCVLCRFINKLMKQFPQHLIWAIFSTVQSLSGFPLCKECEREREWERERESDKICEQCSEGWGRRAYVGGVHEFVPLWHIKFSVFSAHIKSEQNWQISIARPEMKRV